MRSKMAGVAFLIASGLVATGQTPGPLGYSIATPRPINPAEGTTNPSAQATQSQNPYLGSVPSRNTGASIELSFKDALNRGLRYNLGLIETNQARADVRAERLRALSALLPQLSADGRQAYENLSYKEIGLKLPPIPGLPTLPSTSGAFGYQDGRVSLTQSLCRASKSVSCPQERRTSVGAQHPGFTRRSSFLGRNRLLAGDRERRPC